MPLFSDDTNILGCGDNLQQLLDKTALFLLLLFSSVNTIITHVDVQLKLMLTFSVYVVFTARFRDPSSVVLHLVSSFALKGVYFMFFLTRFEGLRKELLSSTQIMLVFSYFSLLIYLSQVYPLSVFACCMFKIKVRNKSVQMLLISHCKQRPGVGHLSTVTGLHGRSTLTQSGNEKAVHTSFVRGPRA